jgi:hypothetical protein
MNSDRIVRSIIKYESESIRNKEYATLPNLTDKYNIIFYKYKKKAIKSKIMHLLSEGMELLQNPFFSLIV